MRLDLRVLSLPASVLFLLASHAISANAAQDDQSPAQLQWNLPIQAKRWPANSPQRRRQLEAVEEHLRLGRSPVGVMKMSADEGEKFYMEYWQFEGELEQSWLSRIESLRARDEKEEVRLLANGSVAVSFRPPFALHTEEGSDPLSLEDLRARKAIEGRNNLAVLAMLEKRGFVCPTGTADCSGINYPNSCCPTSETCFAIQDTGLGPVGCCPNGSTCGGTISGCNSPNTACDDSLGGGCCIPNYVCAGVGCKPSSRNFEDQTLTFLGVINQTLIVTTVITRTFTVSESSSGTTTQTTTVVSTLTSSTISTTTTSSPSSTTSSSGTVTGLPPVRPNSATTSTTTAIQLTGSATLCPTGFYACSAYYAGGCCRTGRNCDTTSCPATSSTTIISSGVTIVVPVGPAATVNSPTGNCATGWTTCAATIGGNCCPSGWQCGTASCSSQGATTTTYLQKESPNYGVSSRGGIGALGAMITTFILGLMLR
jgi:progranulin